MGADIGVEAIRVLTALLPGFITLGVVESVSHCSPSNDSAKVIRALIYTVVDYAIYGAVRGLRTKPGMQIENSIPGTTGDLLWLLGVSVVVGFVICYYIYFDGHRVWRKLRMTSRTCRPDVWIDVFREKARSYVVLHLTDGRRLYGWPEYWPDDPKTGFLFLSQASWLSIDMSGKQVDTEVPGPGILLCREDVKWIEFAGLEQKG